MPNAITTAFIINGILSNSFTSSTKTANRQLRNMQESAKRLEKAQMALNTRFANGGMSIELYDKNMQKLQNRLSSTRVEYNKLKSALAAKTTSGMQFGEAKKNFISSALTISMVAQPFVGAAKTAMAFEAAMSKVGAITKATNSDMALLTKTARELGEKTQYSATQSAEAMSYLGMAGWNTQQIIAGMPGLLNLAAAGGTDLARTADIVSDNLTAFGLAADKSSHMADVYATVITQTNTNVEMLGDTMKYAAPVAYAFGASMEETAALAGLMANSGIKASQAGTALRAGFLRLAGPPKMASKAMEQLGMSMNDITAEQKETAMAMASLGISMSDTNGPKKMSAILTELRDKTANLGQEEKLAALKAIFGQEAATGWLAVLNSGDGVFEKLVSDLEKSDGAADKMAKRMQNNAKGALTRLNSAYESLQISLANGFLPTLANVGDKAAMVVGAFSDYASKNPATIQAVITAAGAFAGLWMVLKTGQTIFATTKMLVDSVKLSIMLYSKCQEYLAGKTILTTMATKAWHTVTFLASTGLSILRATILVTTSTLMSAFRAALIMTNGLLTIMKGSIIKLWAVLMANPWIALATLVVGAAIMIVQNWDTVKQWFITLWDNPALALQQFVDGIKNKFSDALTWVKEKWESISNFLSTPIFGKVSMAAGGENGQQVAHNAYGGIYGKGAFLTTFAENSGESAIPHTPNKRNIGLLAATNAIMGNPLGGNKGQTITATFAPQITVQGGGSDTAAQLDAVMKQKMREFEEMLKRLAAQQRRLSYE